MAKKKITMFKLMTVVSEASSRMLNGSQDDAWAEVCDADEVHFMGDEVTKTCLGAVMMYHRKDGITLVIDTYGGIIEAGSSDIKYRSRVFADNAGYQMAASDLFAAEILEKQA